MTLYRQSDVGHYFSRETAVSLELPFSWIEIGGKAGEVAYGYEIDEAERAAFDFQPQLVIKRFNVPAMSPNAATEFINDLIAVSQPEQLVHKQEDITIDGVAGRMAMLSYLLENSELRVRQLQFFLPVGQTLFTITGLVAEKDAATFLPDMQTAVYSIRILQGE